MMDLFTILEVRISMWMVLGTPLTHPCCSECINCPPPSHGLALTQRWTYTCFIATACTLQALINQHFVSVLWHTMLFSRTTHILVPHPIIHNGPLTVRAPFAPFCPFPLKLAPKWKCGILMHRNYG
jgi:hypothetical protein